MTRIPELLAPAGDWKNLQAALDAGADAIYFGVRGFNMRASAKNFSVRDMPRIVELCHARKVRAYLTANTLVYQAELPALEKLLQAAAAAKVDGVIASDFAVIEAARRHGIEVHASTQMSVGNSSAMLFLHALGVRRFVLARECSLDDIRALRRALVKALGKAAAAEVQIELFAHGAMCVSVSGRCFMSEQHTGKSANRGACTQPCRREYRIVEEKGPHEWVLGENYVMSPKDLCTLPFIEKLIAAGADSLKIEGRIRSPEYVAIVVSAYRKALDFYAAKKGRANWLADFEVLKKGLLERVSEVYNRGFSSGFYCGKPIEEWTKAAGNVATKRRHLVGIVLNYYKKPSVVHLAVQDNGFSEGEELLFEGPTTGFFMQASGPLLLDGQPCAKVGSGAEPTLVSIKPLRRGDKVYVMR